MKVLEKIIEFLHKNPGKTGSEIAKGIFNSHETQSRIYSDLQLGLSTGRLRKEGNGGHHDPFRYYFVTHENEFWDTMKS